MRKIFFLIVILLAFAGNAAADSGISIGNAVQIDGSIRVSLSNNNDYDLDNARVRAIIPELGIRTPLTNVDLDEDERTGINLLLMDDVPSGEHLVRISVKKGGIRRVVYRYVYFE